MFLISIVKIFTSIEIQKYAPWRNHYYFSLAQATSQRAYIGSFVRTMTNSSRKALASFYLQVFYSSQKPVAGC